jgi:pimeloyl-ACP methyl ester carboxylesterase
LRRRLRALFVLLCILYLAGTILGGIGLGWMATHPGRRSISDAEKQEVIAAAGEDAELIEVSMSASDGAILRAWEIRPTQSNGDAVILLHGVGDNRLGVSGYGVWLVRNHYTVLLPDARAHGYSGGDLATYGLRESDDVHHWVDWLQTTTHPNCVFGFGESMGAAQILESLNKQTRYCAVVAESPFATFREVAYARFGRPFHTGPWLGRTFFWPTVEVGFLYVRGKFGHNMELASPPDAVADSNVPVFLIHGLSDVNIPSYHSLEIQRRNPSRVALWRVAGAVHCGTHSVVPQEFERRVLEWFAEHSPPTPNQTVATN